jgi:hypothetical protein
MYWKQGGHENVIVLLGLGLKQVKQALRMAQTADNFVRPLRKLGEW